MGTPSGFRRLENPTEQEWRSLLGRKVSVRYRVHDDPAHPFSEAIGMVQEVAPDPSGRIVIAIVNRRGVTYRFDMDDLIAGKAWS